MRQTASEGTAAATAGHSSWSARTVPVIAGRRAAPLLETYLRRDGPRCPAGLSSLVLRIQAVFTLLFAFVALGERPGRLNGAALTSYGRGPGRPARPGREHGEPAAKVLVPTTNGDPAP